MTTLTINPGVGQVSRWLADLQTDWLKPTAVYSIMRLDQVHAVRVNVESALPVSLLDPDLVVFYGHGHRDGQRLIGHDDVAVIDLNNRHPCYGRAVYAVACYSRKVLGRTIVRDGGGPPTAYFGFDACLLIPPEIQVTTRLKEVMNEGANILHNRHLLPDPVKRYEEAKKAVKRGLLKLCIDISNLSDSVRERGDDKLSEHLELIAVIVGVWQASFDAHW